MSDSSRCHGTSAGDGVNVTGDDKAICAFTVRLENGDTWAFSVTLQWQNLQGACDCSRLVASSLSVPTLVSTGDGGTD
jgi:hypothetical protein